MINSTTPTETSYYCGYCRSRLPEGAKFCPYCGKPVESGLLTLTCIDNTKVKEYFRDILHNNFAQYSIKEDVKVTDLTGDIYDVFKLYKERPNQVYKAEWGKPYDFVIFSDNKPKAVVMLGYGNEHSVKVEYLISKKFAQKIHVPYIGFYSKFPNEMSYVVNRIKENIK